MSYITERKGKDRSRKYPENKPKRHKVPSPIFHVPRGLRRSINHAQGGHIPVAERVEGHIDELEPSRREEPGRVDTWSVTGDHNKGGPEHEPHKCADPKWDPFNHIKSTKIPA